MVSASRIKLLFADLFRIVQAVPVVEYQRRRLSLHRAVALARTGAAKAQGRSASERALLRRAILAVDRRMPGGPNCVRRALLEIRLDSAAAQERLFAGFKAGGGPRSGHAWLESHQDPASSSFDATIAI